MAKGIKKRSFSPKSYLHCVKEKQNRSSLDRLSREVRIAGTWLHESVNKPVNERQQWFLSQLAGGKRFFERIHELVFLPHKNLIAVPCVIRVK